VRSYIDVARLQTLFGTHFGRSPFALARFRLGSVYGPTLVAISRQTTCLFGRRGAQCGGQPLSIARRDLASGDHKWDGTGRSLRALFRQRVTLAGPRQNRRRCILPMRAIFGAEEFYDGVSGTWQGLGRAFGLRYANRHRSRIRVDSPVTRFQAPRQMRISSLYRYIGQSFGSTLCEFSGFPP